MGVPAIIGLAITTIVAILTILYTSLFYLSLQVILGLAEILVGVGSSILGFEIYRQQKKLKEIDTSKKYP